MKHILAKALRIACPALSLVLACLLTPALAQQIVRSANRPQSIVSLAASTKPLGQSVARLAGDSRFENAPANYHVFAAATVGEDIGAEVLTLEFAGETTLTRIKSTNKDFVIEPGSTCLEGISYARGESCSLVVRFNPQGPGHRLGFVTVAHSAEAAPLSFGLVGNGYAPVISFTPAQITTIPGSVSSGTGTINGTTSLAVDGGDIVYIADTGNNKVKEMDSSGNIIPTALGPIATPASIAVDSFGIAYTANVHGSTYYFSIYYPWGTQTAYGYAYTSSTCTVSNPCAFSAVGMNFPANMSIDAFDNLFFEEGTTGAAEMPVANVSGGSGVLNLWHLSDQFAYSSGNPGSFAVDAGGNLYTAYHFSTTTCYILEEPLYNAEFSPTANRVAGGVNCGFTGDGGQGRGAEISSSIGQIAFDIAGNLYFADAGNQRVRRIDAVTGIIRTIAGNGTAGYTGDGGKATSATLSNPTGVAVDSQGQVYILSNAPTAGPTQALRKVGTLGVATFGNQGKGLASSPQFVAVSNTGNSNMVLTNVLITGTNPGDFKIDNTTTTCILTQGTSFNSGQTCRIGIIFTPSAVGTRQATLTLLDNTVNGADRVLLSGSGVLRTPIFKITSPPNGASFTSGTAVTFSVSVTSSSAPQPTGTVQFKVDGANHGSPVTVSSTGTASTSVTGLSTASHTLSATYSGDANYAAAGPISVSITVKAAAVKFTSPLTTQAITSATIAAKVTVTAAPGPAPTGNVKFSLDGVSVGSAAIVSGAASLNFSKPLVGTHHLVAAYGGDKYHLPAQASETITVQ